MVVRSHATTLRPLRCSSPASKYPTVGAFIAWVRREHGFSQPELGTVVGRSVTRIAAYEQGLRRPPATFLLDILDAMPVEGIGFNDVATWYAYRPVTTLDPAGYRSIHEYMAAVRVFFGYSRTGFAATLGCTVNVVRAYEHCVKPDEILLRRLVRRHTAPQVQYRDVATAFRTLRPTFEDRRLREIFSVLRNTQPESTTHGALRDRLIIEHLDLARALARRYRHWRVASDDAAQVAYEALIRAVDRCDPRYGDFIPYLRKWIAGSIREYAHTLSVAGTARTPLSRQTVAVARDALTQNLAGEPTRVELAAHLGVPLRTLENTLQAWQAAAPVSIDVPHQRTGRPIASTLPAEPGGRSHELEVSDLVHGLLDQLRPDHRRLIELRYLHNADIDKIAAQVASSTEDVEVRLAEALEHLRYQARHVYDA